MVVFEGLLGETAYHCLFGCGLPRVIFQGRSAPLARSPAAGPAAKLCASREAASAATVGVPSEREARRVVKAAELGWPAVIEQ